ncbi:phage/plasmid replication protein, II/X family [Halalkalibacter oceani]|uniref:phage/plasmid replication protein, II/X family n=1 Tax=Halalkalibacter oceani TaxID=1653776 RepID=UPI0033996AA8
MSVDTVKLRSPFLREEVAEQIENRGMLRQGIDLKTGEKIYAFTTVKLKGMYNSTISVKVERSLKGFMNRKPYKKITPPFVTIECSLHKALLGHNILGGTMQFLPSVRWLIQRIEKQLGISLPQAEEWQVRRIDVASTFVFQSAEEVFRWLNGLKFETNQKIQTFGRHGISMVNSLTALKLYHKGMEFKKNDLKRLKNLLDKTQLHEMQLVADSTLRTEVEIKFRKLRHDYGHEPVVSDITMDYLLHTYNQQVSKFLNEDGNHGWVVREVTAVRRRLSKEYGQRRANSLFNVWYQLATLGETEVKKSYCMPTYYEKIRLLKKAGCSWHNVSLNEENQLPTNFTLFLDNKRIKESQSPIVTEMLKPFQG